MYSEYIKIIEYFPKPFDISVELDLSDYATKADLKKATVIDTSNLLAKSDLASLKAEVDKIDVDNLKTVSVELSELSNVVNNDIIKRTVCDKSVAKVNAAEISSRFVL